MNRKQTLLLAGAGAVVAAAALTTSMFLHHQNLPTSSPAPQRADVIDRTVAISDGDIVAAIQKADAPVAGLVARNVGGIVILRGTADAVASQRAVDAVKSLGFTRVANLITPANAIDDEGIRRDAERVLAQTRSLDGCVLKVSCDKGVLAVSGTVHNELQIDAARQALRGVRGAQQVRVELENRS
jgi:osmotically-inducible protein OsmY